VQSRTEAGVAATLAGLRASIERRLRLLNEEISHYPGPIARCDQHLAALIESRTALFERLRRVDELAAAAAEIDALLRSEADDTPASGQSHELEAS
jgi:predicted component of type VI protein secretion system